MEKADKRRIDELRVEAGVKKSVDSRLKWVVHVKRFGDEKPAKISDAQKVKSALGPSGRRMGNNSKRLKELETVDRGRRARKGSEKDEEKIRR